MDAGVLVTLGEIIDSLEHGTLTAVCRPADRAAPVRDVVIHDPCDEQARLDGAIVLGVGVARPADIADLLVSLSAAGAAVLVIREPVLVDNLLVRAVERTNVSLLGLRRGVSWADAADELRARLVGRGPADRSDRLATITGTDLFAVANATASLLGAPVTIEDNRSAVLAYSGGQQEADSSRVESILARQVPAEYVEVLRARGVFGKLARSTEPIFAEPVTATDGTPQLGRAVIAVRAGTEVLGSIWVAVPAPLGPQRAAALKEAAKMVALHLLRLRALTDPGRSLRAERTAAVLRGGADAEAAADALNLGSGDHLVVGVMPADDPSGDEARRVNDLDLLSDTLHLQLNAVHPGSTTAVVDGVVYGVVPVRHATPGGPRRAADPAAVVVRTVEAFVSGVSPRHRVLVAIGSVASEVARLTASRADVDRTLRVLASGRSERTVAHLDDVRVAALLLEMGELARSKGDGPSGPLARLVDYDTTHNGQLVETLRAWLENFGDATAAAASLHVHPNTFRYRVRRVASVGGLDLTDPDARFDALLQLRLLLPVTAQPAASACAFSVGSR